MMPTTGRADEPRPGICRLRAAGKMTATRVMAATAVLAMALPSFPSLARANLAGPAVEVSAAAETAPATLEKKDEQRGEQRDEQKDEQRDQQKYEKKAAPARGGASSGPSTAAAPAPDLAKLRADYDRLREQLFEARVRSQKAAELVYSTRLDVRLRWKGGPDFVIRKARFLLDGAELWDSGDRAQTDDLIEVASRSVKPGPHALSVALEIRPRSESKGGTKTGADKLGYTSEHVFAIVVAGEGQTHVLLTGDEDGDPPEYEPGLELEVKTEK